MIPEPTATFVDYPCRGCGLIMEIKTWDKYKEVTERLGTFRLCTGCWSEMMEGLAARIDPTYDPNAMNDWERCAKIIWKMGAYTKKELGLA